MKLSFVVLAVALCSIQPSHGLQPVLIQCQQLAKLLEMLPLLSVRVNSTEMMINTIENHETALGKMTHWLNSIMTEITAIQDDTNIRATFDIIEDLQFPDPDGKFARWRSEVEKLMDTINSIFHDLRRITQTSETIVHDWKNISKTAKESIDLQGLHTKLFPRGERPSQRGGYIFHLAYFSNTSRRKNCPQASMMRYFLGHLFEAICVTEIKGVTALIYTALIQNCRYDAWRVQVAEVNSNYKERFLDYLLQTKNAMHMAPADLTTCEPSDGIRVRDETYFEAEKLEQVSIFRFDLKDNGCENVINKKLFTFTSERDNCSGQLSDCKYSKWLSVCRLDNGSNRYQWIKSEVGNYGMKLKNCPNGTISEYKGVDNLSYGHCICNCRGHMRHWISVTPVLANTSDNMVVTGARFVWKDRILYIQLKQGRLVKNAWVDPSSQSWIPLPNNPEVMEITPANTKFYLDVIRVPVDQVVVGVTFENNKGCSIVVSAKRFNYTTGEMYDDIMDRDADHSEYDELQVPRRNSIYTSKRHTSLTGKKWVTLAHSDWRHDVGQSVVPLFDGIAIETNPPLPLGGFGIIHKGTKGYAGYISPKLTSYPYSKILKMFIQNQINGSPLERWIHF
ncbi:uncharacterized protein [Fopius arisanus]|uniref:Uncharacterized protein n=1 Tax=Fopius arisanus TaxID=64838 RepID=A0A9R1TCC4_9HYME|nr:PREDICTED: uncharacterized protein LOC105269208 [Fopius arisanus]